MGEQKRAQVNILISAALWGCIGVFFNMVTDVGFSRIQAVALRVWLAAVLYFVYLFAADRKKLKIRLRDIYYFIGTGVLSLLFFNLCYFNCIAMSSMSAAAVLLYTAPIFVSLMSAVCFREKITPKKIAALIMTFVGCIFVTGLVGGAERMTPVAILYGLGAGFGYALYSIFGKYAMRRYEPETVTVYTFIFCGAALLFIAKPVETALMVTTWRAVVGMLGLGIACCILPYIFYTKGLQKTEAGKAAIIATLEPVTASVLSVAFFDDAMTIGKGFGIFLVVGAIVMMNLGGKSK